MMETYRNALILGLGASGEAAAGLLLGEGAQVTVADAVDSTRTRPRAKRLERMGAKVLLGTKTLPGGDYDVAVVSPGLRTDAPWVLDTWHRGVPLVSELELGWSRRRCPVIAVTGSNGKSTVVKLLCHILSEADLRAAPAGNYGPALSGVVGEDLDWLVVEVSSFQLEWSSAFRSEVGLLLNVQPNHLDRHGTMQNYLGIKARLFAHTRPGDICLVPSNLLESVRGLSEGQGQWFSFGMHDAGSFIYRDGRILCEGATLADLSGTRFANEVMGPSMAAVYGAAEACGVQIETVRRALDTFEPLPFRMQLTGRRKDTNYINDAKCTSLSAMGAALRMCPPGPVRLIAGGVLKEYDIFRVKKLLAERTAGVYLIGRAAKAMLAAWSDEVHCVVCGDLETAVERVCADARPGETVLLSPGCASFDQFGSFEERGRRFDSLVSKQLRDEPETGEVDGEGMEWTGEHLGVR